MKRKAFNKDRSLYRLAFFIIGISVAVIAVISFTVIKLADTETQPQMAQMVFTAVLPLLGTWVGAILAYYFSKDNLETASQTTLDAVRAGGASGLDALVRTVMTPVNRIRPRQDVADDAAAKELSLLLLYNAMKGSGMSRIPVFADGKVLYVVHEPDIDKFAQGKGVASIKLSADDKIELLLSDTANDLANAITAIAAVPGTATIADARSALSKVSGAKDLFVTDDGTLAGHVLGWLTNSDLARAS